MSQANHRVAGTQYVKLENVLRRASGDYIYVLDATGVVLDCNDRFAGEYATGEESPIGKQLSTWMTPEEVRLARKKWHFLASGGKFESGSRKMKNGVGQSRVLDVLETPVVIDGDVVAILGVARDITEEALLEEKLWETQETRDSAVEYSVRASLGLIKGYIYSMRNANGLTESQRARFGRVVTDEIDALGRTIENLLSARGMHDDTQASAELCDLKSVLDTAVAAIEPEALRREIQVYRDEPSEKTEMIVPEQALVRLIQNLLEHCVMRITHNGRIHIKLHDSGEYVDVMISDNGSAVSEDQARALFLLKQQANRDDSTPAGSRTALYVARLFSEAMGGAVTARTSAEGGLEFHLMLPRQLAGFSSAWPDPVTGDEKYSAITVK